MGRDKGRKRGKERGEQGAKVLGEGRKQALVLYAQEHTDLMLVNQVCSVVLYKQKICDHCAGIVTLNYYKYHSLEIKFNPFVAELETATNVRQKRSTERQYT